MPDEVNASFVVPGEPSAILAAWRADPPSFLSIDGYKQIDDSYESLVYEANVTTGFVKITTFGFGKTVYRLTFTFRAGTDGGTQVSALGQALERTRDAFGSWLAGLPASRPARPRVNRASLSLPRPLEWSPRGQ